MTRGQILQQLVAQRRNRRIAGEAEAYEAMKRYVFAHPALRGRWADWVSENMAAARAAAQGDAAASREAGAAFHRALAETLAQEGLDAGAFTYHPLCPRCGDLGMTGEGAQRYCSCVLNAAALKLREATGIREDFTFERFDLSLFPDTPLPTLQGTQRELMQLRRDQCLTYTQDFPGSEGRSLLLTGGTGLGKTYLMHAVANALVDRGFTVMMVTAYQLVRASLDRQEGQDALALYSDADLLLIDDLGSEPLYQKITVETLFALINDRMARLQPLAFSTNLTPAELYDRYGARLASRLMDRSVVRVLRLEGQDVRLQRKKG